MVTVYAPATIGNVSVGFDVLGLALCLLDNSKFGDTVNVKKFHAFDIKISGKFCSQLPQEKEKNIIYQCWEYFCYAAKIKKSFVLIELEKDVPVSSGLGSSACSIVSVLTALNCYYKYPLDNNQLLLLMGEMEGKISGNIHLDNILPCFFGGMQLVLKQKKIISQKIPSFNNWIWIVAYPGTKLETSVSRSVLPKKYFRDDCIIHSQYLSGFVHACHTQQEFLAIQCIKDIIAEPYRSKLLPVNLDYIRTSLIANGALTCGISGGGPTIFVLCNDQNISIILSNWLLKYYLQNSLGFVYSCRLNNFGTRIMAE